MHRCIMWCLTTNLWLCHHYRGHYSSGDVMMQIKVSRTSCAFPTMSFTHLKHSNSQWTHSVHKHAHSQFSESTTTCVHTYIRVEYMLQ